MVAVFNLFIKRYKMLKDNTQVDINCSKLARQYGCDRRTVSKAINVVKNNLPPPKTNKPRKTEN